MKTIISILMFLLISINGISQSYFYFPNGKKIDFPFSTINDILDTLNISDTYMHISGDCFVWYKRLTNIPLFLQLDKPIPSKIPSLLNTFNYQEYLLSYSYYHDLKEMKNSLALTKEYIDGAFNKPDIVDTLLSGLVKSIYKKANLYVEYSGTNVVNFNIINYNAIEKHQLSIPYWSVIKDEYSIGFEISLINKSKKVIKYLFFTVKAFNRVEDIIDTKTVTGVGPIRPSGEATFKFESIVYTNVASKLFIEKIKIQYMDGSIRELNRASINSIQIIDWKSL